MMNRLAYVLLLLAGLLMNGPSSLAADIIDSTGPTSSPGPTNPTPPTLPTPGTGNSDGNGPTTDIEGPDSAPRPGTDGTGIEDAPHSVLKSSPNEPSSKPERNTDNK